MIEEYLKYSNININEFNYNISNVNSIIIEEKNKLFDFYKNSNKLIFDILKLEFNINKKQFLNKINLFQPYLLTTILDVDYKSSIEYMSGLGMFSELMKDINPYVDVTYYNDNIEMMNFTKWRMKNKNLNISYEINGKYDIVFIDGSIQYFEKDDQYKVIEKSTELVNDNGILSLLIDISGKKNNSINNDVDIVSLHNYIENRDMICIYGRNTFSSIWKKII